jgi:NAD(P)-dependent dehydrogenase (short-subunit alcohol dehydrogenase family)
MPGRTLSSDGAPLRHRVAVVTGALGKLGPSFVDALAAAGATVVGLDLRNGTAGSEGVSVLAADVLDREALDAARSSIERDHGIPSVLVNAAGVDQPPEAASETFRIEDVPLDDFRRTLDVNLAGVFNACQVFGSAMRDARRGSIVNVGSLYASVAPEPSLYDHLHLDPPFLKPAAYGASKAGVVQLTRYLARLWGPSGVRVNVLSPGGVANGQDDEFRRKYTARVPLGRMASLGDLAGPLVFLASDASAYVTGQEVRVDGGFTA